MHQHVREPLVGGERRVHSLCESRDELAMRIWMSNRGSPGHCTDEEKSRCFRNRDILRGGGWRGWRGWEVSLLLFGIEDDEMRIDCLDMRKRGMQGCRGVRDGSGV